MTFRRRRKSPSNRRIGTGPLPDSLTGVLGTPGQLDFSFEDNTVLGLALGLL